MTKHPYRKNTLQRIILIQNITLKYKGMGLSQVWIYHNKVAPVYCISLRTYDRYLAVNAKKLLKEIK